MKKQVEVTKWVDSISGKHNISIKYHFTYLGFSYLRIDDQVFWGTNLPLYLSQQNFALEFSIKGEGGQLLSEYFEELWKNQDICSNVLGFEES